MKRFTNIYPLQKTLRFELKPIGKTIENINQNDILEQDNKRADSYIKVKKIIDDYHRYHIETALSDFKLKLDSDGKNDSLSEFFFYYKLNNRDETSQKAFNNVHDNLRKATSKQLKSSDIYKRIDKEELIKEDLVKFVESDEAKIKLIKEFQNFTSYFTGFHENRQNMYSEEAKATAIAYRMIHENLPKFIDNMTIFEKVNSVPELRDNIDSLYKDFEAYLNVSTINDMFQLSYYSVLLTQKQIEVYNAIIGGKSEGEKKKKGLNEYINLYNQKQTDRTNRLPKFKPLFKQILSDREAISWLPEKFESDNELLEKLELCYRNFSADGNETPSLFKRTENLLLALPNYNLNRIYIRNDAQLTDISQKLFGNWSVIPKALLEKYKEKVSRKRNESDESYEERLNKTMRSQDSFSIEFINSALDKYGFDEYKKSVCDHFTNLDEKKTDTENVENVFVTIEVAYNEIRELLNSPYPEGKNLAQDKPNVEKIKNLLDAIKRLLRFIKPLCGKGNEAEKDETFYGEFTSLWEELDKITPLYNMVRNYMTRKPYSVEKFKLNFENTQLLKGWDLNKESDNTCVLLRKNGLYYLAIMNKKNNKVFESKKLQSDGEFFEKMEYKLLPGANKMLPKVFFSKSRIGEFKPSKQLLDNYSNGTHKKGDKFNLKDCHKLINFYKCSIEKHEDWKNFDFNFSDTESYEDLSGFYREVEQQGYKISFRNVSVDYVNSLVDEGKIYLFQIYNKDFSPHSKGTPNLFTLYWKMLFDERNTSDVVFKLNGQAEVFYRKASISYDKPTHPANQPIENKNELNAKKTSTFNYDLFKDKRFSQPHFQFHVPITINFKSTGRNNINALVHEHIRQSDDLHIIGIDRGERHLLYLSLIDMKGKIINQFSLNRIDNEYNGNTNPTNYHDLLAKKEKERDEARKSWLTIENIKELKEGYLSQVVHKITKLMIEYNAIVVLEDLNMGFMRGRQKVEKSVYQKFEKMLIDKLNFLADKQEDPQEAGGLLKAYQLTNKFESFEKLGKQSGFLFYTQAWNTSKIDPVTGFVNLFDTRYSNIDNAKAFFCKFDSIRYNSEKDWFEFEFDYSNFTSKADGTRTKWTLCTCGKRIENFRNPEKESKWDSKEVDLTARFKELLEKFDIKFRSDLKAEIANQNTKEFFENLMHLLKLTLQIRNSEIGTDVDYLQSPVADENGVFYNSDTEKQKGSNAPLPIDADANGAYNIARKGLWIIKQIKDTPIDEKLNLAISNKEWLKFAQEKPYLED
jgi:CRISPR-associated protein Cpf1